uniref:Peptidase S1 domain-containing protein n=1 Tax=Dromaius novaehollandiae TaxID=8790 RepID=A0A8C4JZ08_DRONO
MFSHTYIASLSLIRPPDLTVVVGGIDLSHKLEKKKLDSLILHENFDSESMENDIALILLDSPIQLNEQKMPICLPFISDLHVWKDCWVAGWGTTLAGERLRAFPSPFSSVSWTPEAQGLPQTLIPF